MRVSQGQRDGKLQAPEARGQKSAQKLSEAESLERRSFDLNGQTLVLVDGFRLLLVSGTLQNL